MEMSTARISSALGARPSPYVGGDCASAEPPRSNTRVMRLSERIVHASISGDSPRLNGVVQPGHPVGRIQGRVPELCNLRTRRLNLAQVVGAARQQLRFVAVPRPRNAESAMRHALCRPLDLGTAPLPAAIGGYFHA